jgi:hypothetical protein
MITNFHRARACGEKGRIDMAIQDLEKALSLDQALERAK